MKDGTKQGNMWPMVFAGLWLLVPLVMLAIHQVFGFTDALMAIPAGEFPPEWQRTYNLYMCLMIWFAPVGSFVTYLCLRPKTSVKDPIGCIFMAAGYLLFFSSFFVIAAMSQH